MTNELSTRNGGGLVQLDPEAFAGNLARFGEEVQAKSWIGTLLRFERGQYKAGAGDAQTVVPIGTRLTLALESVETGWQKWLERSLVKSVTGLVGQGYQMPERDDLGDLDTTMWPRDPVTGQPKDPWQKMARAVMYGAKNDAGMLHTFSTSTKGGLGALGKLCTEAGKLMRMHPGASPIVALRTDSYKHKKLGTNVDFPVFEIVGWNDDPWEGAAVRKED